MKNLYKILFIFFFCFSAFNSGHAQTASPFECATVMEGNSGALVSPLSTPVYSGSYDLEYLETFPPISFNIHFWIINKTDGTADSNVTAQDIQLNMDIINERYKPMGICFVLHGYGTINNTSIYENTNIGAITSYAGQNGYVVSNCFNVYLPRTLASGNGVTYFGSDKLVVTKANVLGTFGAVRGNALAHELAHDFGLMHPWGGANGTTTTAEHVTRDVNDITNYNALNQGDKVHDTAAMASFWNEAMEDGVTIQDIIDTANCEYLGNLTDNLGVPFSLTPADVGNPMGYTWGPCVTGFSVGQGIRIREYIAGSPSSASVLAMTTAVCVDCVESLTISEPVTFSENFTVVNNITASSAINDNIQVIYSGTQVILQPGFDVTGTDIGYFIAEVNPCELNSGGRYANPELSSNEENKIAGTLGTIFYITPNPAHSFLTITSTEEIKSIIITSLDGKILFANTPNDKITTIDVAIDAYSDGIYNIVVTTANGKKQIKKLVKN